MEEKRNNRAVERRLKEALRFDRARLQVGRISHFGLLEMSRQRLGASFFETITEPCKHCAGTGYVRSVEILAVSILRAIRHSCSDKQAGVIYVYTNPETIAYIMNFKKGEIMTTEKNYDVHIFIHPSDDVGSQGFNIKRRKSLSDDERREIEMQVTTGKVNQLGLEKSYFDGYIEDKSEQSEKRKPRENNNRRKNNNNRRDRSDRSRDNNNRDSNQKTSLLRRLFSFGNRSN
jgi:ribonuclease E